MRFASTQLATDMPIFFVSVVLRVSVRFVIIHCIIQQLQNLCGIIFVQFLYSYNSLCHFYHNVMFRVFFLLCVSAWHHHMSCHTHPCKLEILLCLSLFSVLKLVYDRTYNGAELISSTSCKSSDSDIQGIFSDFHF